MPPTILHDGFSTSHDGVDVSASCQERSTQVTMTFDSCSMERRFAIISRCIHVRPCCHEDMAQLAVATRSCVVERAQSNLYTM